MEILVPCLSLAVLHCILALAQSLAIYWSVTRSSLKGRCSVFDHPLKQQEATAIQQHEVRST